MAKARKARKQGIPRHRSYQTGIASAAYDLEHMYLAFGADNVRTMLIEIEQGNIEGVRKMLRAWTKHQFGDKFAMIDHMCSTETAYGLTAATAAKNGASAHNVSVELD